MNCVSVCPTAYSPIRYCEICQTFTPTNGPIHCINCGVVISQYEHIKEEGLEWWGYRDTTERIGSADSLRCGRCYQKYAMYNINLIVSMPVDPKDPSPCIECP